jgi:hypothetical protein
MVPAGIYQQPGEKVNKKTPGSATLTQNPINLIFSEIIEYSIFPFLENQKFYLVDFRADDHF